MTSNDVSDLTSPTSGSADIGDLAEQAAALDDEPVAAAPDTAGWDADPADVLEQAQEIGYGEDGPGPA